MRIAVHLGLVAIGLSACSEVDAPSAGPSLEIAVAPLTLAGVERACYDITVTGEDGPVWSKSDICSDEFGNGLGDIAYVGACDATDRNGGGATNTVTLELTELYASDAPGAMPIAHSEYKNPCDDPQDGDYSGSGPCTRQVICAANGDAAVSFNLTILRDAGQGFFDVAVTFDDIFCSAKVDCTRDVAGTQPLELLFNGNDRDQTAVVALACTAGPGQSTTLDVNSVKVECGTAAGGGGPTGTPFFSQVMPLGCDAGGPDSVLAYAASYYGSFEEITGYQTGMFAYTESGSGFTQARVSQTGPTGHAWESLIANIFVGDGTVAGSLGDINDAGTAYDAAALAILQRGPSGWSVVQEFPGPSTGFAASRVDPYTKILGAPTGQEYITNLTYLRPTQTNPLRYGAPETPTMPSLPSDVGCDSQTVEMLHGVAVGLCFSNSTGGNYPIAVRLDTPTLTGEILGGATVPGCTFQKVYSAVIIDGDHLTGTASYICGSTGVELPLLWTDNGSTFVASELVGARDATHPQVGIQRVAGAGGQLGAYLRQGDFTTLPDLLRPDGAGGYDHSRFVDAGHAVVTFAFFDYVWPTLGSAQVVLGDGGGYAMYGTLPTTTGDVDIVMQPILSPSQFDSVSVQAVLPGGRALLRATPKGGSFSSGETVVVTFGTTAGEATIVDIHRVMSPSGTALGVAGVTGQSYNPQPFDYASRFACERLVGYNNSTGEPGHYALTGPTSPTLTTVNAEPFSAPVFGSSGGGAPATTTTLNPTIVGNAWNAVTPDPSPLDPIWQYAVYRGNETMSCDGTPCQKRYWNVAVGFDPDADDCTLKFSATASNGTLTNGKTPVGTAWPIIDVEVQLTEEGGGLACAQHPLDGADGGVATTYVQNATQFCYSFDGTTVTNHCP